MHNRLQTHYHIEDRLVSPTSWKPSMTNGATSRPISE